MPREVEIAANGERLRATLSDPHAGNALVIFAHGSGSSRHSRRNQFVASALNERGFATLLLDLLTENEDEIDRKTGALRFNIALLARRVASSTAWSARQRETAGRSVGYFGASTGAAAALVAAAERDDVRAVVSRGGRPDLAGDALESVTAPTLLIVGGNDTTVIRLNELAKARMKAPCEMTIVPNAGHLFEEPGALQAVAHYAADWFSRHL